MARFRRYRKYTRRQIAKWSPNIQEIFTTSIVPTTTGVNSWIFTLAYNPNQINTAVSQIYTVKNFSISFTFESPSTDLQKFEDISAYIMFVPQGMNVTNDYNLEHPEYIMASKFIGSPSSDSGQNYQPQRISTRLSRKLNTGDSVRLFIKYNTQAESTSYQMTISGIARWFTKAN